MPDPIHTKDGRVLWALDPRGPEPNNGSLATAEDVEQACGCEVQSAERDGYMMLPEDLEVQRLRGEVERLLGALYRIAKSGSVEGVWRIAEHELLRCRKEQGPHLALADLDSPQPDQEKTNDDD